MSRRLSAVGSRIEDVRFEVLTALLDSAEGVRRAWSGSNLGFHAEVYYEGLAEPPPGAHFSSEWGFLGQFQGTTGAWREYRHGDVLAQIEEHAGSPDLTALDQDSADARRITDEARDEIVSIINAVLKRGDDAYIEDLLDRVRAIDVLDYDTCLRAQLPSGQIISRDSTAVSQGLRSAPHQEVIARVVSIRAPFDAASQLAGLCDKARRHLHRVGGLNAPTEEVVMGDRVVIGHGGSPLWRELKDFVADRLGLPWDEFNRVAVAGVATVDRLQEMLDGSCFALLVATAEDETVDGGLQARQNVIHEIGLFQGRLGFGRAVVLLEEGCAEFSNIHGLGQIRFPRGDIAARFDDVRRVLEREACLNK